MRARYRDVEVQAAAGGLDVACTVENAGPETWRPAEGYAVSYQIFDPSNGQLIEDGVRTPPAGEVEPGKSAPVRVRIALPGAPGDYRVYVSPLVEHQAWFYEQGSPFLLLEARVGEQGVELKRQLVVTLGRVKRETLARSLGRAFWYPVRTLVRHGPLIRSLVRRDIAGRYRGSYAGLFWTVIHPLLMMMTYYFVFGIVLRTRFGSDERPSSFVLYFLAGMLPWLAFSEAVGRSTSVIAAHATFVKKLVFPLEILPVNLVVAGLVSELFGAGIFLAGLWYFDRPFPATMLWLPVVLLPQVLLTLGLCWFLAALGVFLRDLGQLIGFLLTLWFFVTPICYPEASLPQGWMWLFEQNPLYVLVRHYRLIFLEGAGPEWGSLGRVAALGAVMFVVGHGWFYKLRRSFADVV